MAQEESVRLVELESDFAQDPKAAVRKARRAESASGGYSESKLNALEKAISSENIRKLGQLTDDLETKKEAAKIASLDLSKDEPLNGVGSNTWKILWEAARAYSTSEAYLDLKFPVTERRTHVVSYATKNLTKRASQRLRRFEAFVQDKTQREEATARAALSSL